MEVHNFQKGISLKVNVRAGLDFEFAYYDIAVEYVSHYTTGTLSRIFL